MSAFQPKLPFIIDLQPEPEEKLLRLPGWMKYLFVLLYLGCLVGLGVLLKDGVLFFRLYQRKVQAVRISAETTRTIAFVNRQLAENKAAQSAYEQFKRQQRSIARPGPLLEWLPNAIGKAQRAHYISVQQAQERIHVRYTIEKPINDPLNTAIKPPADYQLISASEETPKYTELPVNQRPNPNNEFSALAVQLKKL